jgi:5-enolpyruvylshikimate-3-phosphate synthase
LSGRKFFMFQMLDAGPGGAIRGELRVPGDKSISHR